MFFLQIWLSWPKSILILDIGMYVEVFAYLMIDDLDKICVKAELNIDKQSSKTSAATTQKQ